MEALSRLVTESLVRHGLDRPLDYRRLQWSRWFRCESHHSLLQVPSQPGVFALAEEIPVGTAASVPVVPVGTAASALVGTATPAPVGTAASAVQRSEASPFEIPLSGHDFTLADSTPEAPALATEGRRLLAVSQFFADDDMAFVLDRMLAFTSPWRTRLNSGRYFIRYVIVEDPFQRRSICNTLNQWITDSAGKTTGLGSGFASSLELTPPTEYPSRALGGRT